MTKRVYLTVFDGDQPEDDTYDLVVKKGKEKEFKLLIFTMCNKTSDSE